MIDPQMEFFIDPSRCIGCQACYHACAECETHRGISMIHLEYVDRAESASNSAGGVHALRRSSLRQGLSRRRDQKDPGWRRAVGS